MVGRRMDGRHMADGSPELTILSLMHGTHLWVVALIMLVVAEIYAVGLMLMARYRYGGSRLKLNNEVAGFKFAVVGVFYAVLLAFVVIAVWENYSNTEAAVRNHLDLFGIFHHALVFFSVGKRYRLTIRRQASRQNLLCHRQILLDEFGVGIDIANPRRIHYRVRELLRNNLYARILFGEAMNAEIVVPMPVTDDDMTHRYVCK